MKRERTTLFRQVKKEQTIWRWREERSDSKEKRKEKKKREKNDSSIE